MHNNKTIDYVYNHLGNISYKTETITNPQTNAQTVKTINYRYGADGKDGWDYLLTGYDENNNNKFDENEKISYDNIGNPITYRGASMAWKGRQLTGHTKNGVTSTFSYDADGLRGSKTVGGVHKTQNRPLSPATSVGATIAIDLFIENIKNMEE